MQFLEKRHTEPSIIFPISAAVICQGSNPLSLSVVGSNFHTNALVHFLAFFSNTLLGCHRASHVKWIYRQKALWDYPTRMISMVASIHCSGLEAQAELVSINTCKGFAISLLCQAYVDDRHPLCRKLWIERTEAGFWGLNNILLSASDTAFLIYEAWLLLTLSAGAVEIQQRGFDLWESESHWL